MQSQVNQQSSQSQLESKTLYLFFNTNLLAILKPSYINIQINIMKTSYTILTIVLFTSNVSANKSTQNDWTLEQCFPSVPWYSYEGTDYIFTREKYNSICVDSHGKQYQYGKILGVNPPIDEPNSGCSAACVSGYGRGEARGCTSMKPEKLVGFNYNCDEDACYW